MSYLRSAASLAVKDYRSKIESMNVFKKAFLSWNFKHKVHTGVGLKQEDSLRKSVILTEALKRLPREEYEKRTFRINTAFFLTLNRDALPREEWIKYEEDDPYLAPYLELVARELAEYHDWDSR